MMPNSFNGDWEDKMLKGVPKEIENLKKLLTPELEEYKKANSVINSSVDFIENPVNVDGFQVNDDLLDGNSNGLEQSRANVRVRTMEGPHGFNSNPVRVNNTEVSTYSGYSEGYSQQSSKSGSVTTLILVCSAVLIMLVVFVSLFILNYIGF